MLHYLAVAPEVFTLSVNQTYERGDNVTLNCLAIGGPDIVYQWQGNGTVISIETSSTLMFSNINASTGGQYSCVVSNSAGYDSASTFVFISPYFITQPEDKEAHNGLNIILMCEAEAFPTPQYQWVRVDRPINDAVLGVRSTLLSFMPFMYGDEGSYFCNALSGGVNTQSTMAILRGI